MAAQSPEKDIRRAMLTAKGLARSATAQPLAGGGRPSSDPLAYQVLPYQAAPPPTALRHAIKHFSQARKAQFHPQYAPSEPSVAPRQESRAELAAAPPMPPPRPATLDQGMKDTSDLGQTLQTGFDMINGKPQPSAKGLIDPNSGVSGRVGLIQPSAKFGDLGPWSNDIRRAAAQYGVDPDYLARTIQIESGGNPNAHNPSGAAGLAQFMPATAKQFGVSNPYDPVQSIYGLARFTAANQAELTNALSRPPTPYELYMAHQQGANGAIKLISNPDLPAGQVVGASAVAGNGGNPRLPASAFMGMWAKRFEGAPTLTAAQPSPSEVAGPPQHMAPAQTAPDSGGFHMPNVYHGSESSQYPAPGETSGNSAPPVAAPPPAKLPAPANQSQSSIDVPNADQVASLGPSDSQDNQAQPMPQNQQSPPPTQQQPDQEPDRFGDTIAPDDTGIMASARGGHIIARALQAVRKHRASGGANSAPAAGTGYQIPGYYSNWPSNGIPNISGDYNPLNPNQGIEQLMRSPLGLAAAFGVIPINVNGGPNNNAPTNTGPSVLPPLIPKGQVGNATPSYGAPPMGQLPMASPQGMTGGDLGQSAPQVSMPQYNNSLDAVLGTNSPTMNDIFGFNYPNIPPPQPNIYVAPQPTLGPSGSYNAPSTGSSGPATDTISQGAFLGSPIAPTGGPPILTNPAPVSYSSGMLGQSAPQVSARGGAIINNALKVARKARAGR